MSLDTEMDRQILGRQRQKLGCFLPEGLELQPGCQCVLGWKKKKASVFLFLLYFVDVLKSTKDSCNTAPGIFIPVDNRHMLRQRDIMFT